MKHSNTLRNLSVIVFFLLTATYSFAQKKVKDKVLANKVYTVEVTEQKSKKPQTSKDEITFKADKVSSKFSALNKFPAAPYIVEVDSSSGTKDVSFTAESTNPDKSTLKWTGTITDSDIEGTAVHEHKGKVKQEYFFTGTLKEKKKKE